MIRLKKRIVLNNGKKSEENYKNLLFTVVDICCGTPWSSRERQSGKPVKCIIKMKAARKPSLNYIPPPFFWHKYGNRQTFPKPTAYPRVANMYSSLFPHPFLFPSSRTSTCNSFSVLPFASAMACSSLDGEGTMTVICPFCSFFSVIIPALWRAARSNTPRVSVGIY